MTGHPMGKTDLDGFYYDFHLDFLVPTNCQKSPYNHNFYIGPSRRHKKLDGVKSYWT